MAKSANASAILIINNRPELFKMVCEDDEPDVEIGIPAVMLPNKIGEILENGLTNNSIGKYFYGLWLLVPSYWSAWTAREAAIEHDKLLKDASDESSHVEGEGASPLVEISTMAAILFVVIASCFLVMFYKLMSFWFIEILVVLFCIGGIEGLQTCLVALLSWVGTVLLGCAFFYDIFWVFVSKWSFHESVMIVVARLLVTYVALNLMDGHGQPALLYIVPYTLGTFLTLGQMRGDLKVLWTRGEPERPCPHIRLQSSHSQ
ncbi:hypothetical protein ABKV19_023317 [Rosa sericea]